MTTHQSPSGRKILITGATGQVAKPITMALAADNDVWALGRFRSAGAGDELSTAGITCVAVDLNEPDFSAVPTDFDYVLNFAVSYAKDVDFDADIRVNAESLGLLMSHCRGSRAFLHCSSTAVYRNVGREPRTESHPLGDSMAATMPTYSISKIASEAVVRTMARVYDIPTTIARLNVPFSRSGGWPAYHVACIIAGTPVVVHPDAPSVFAPIFSDDLVRTIPSLLAGASVPATIVNWGGSHQVSIEEWATYAGELLGMPVQFAHSEATISSVVPDTAALRELVGEEISGQDWRVQLRAMIDSLHPGMIAVE